MRLLLDTHVFLWAIRKPERLSPTARAHLENPRNELIVSSAVLWEIAIKYRKGKLDAGEAIVAAPAQVLAQLRATELAMTGRHTVLAGMIEWDHGDPFDRMFAAQSILEGIPLVTDDRVFGALPGVHVLW